MKSSFSLLRKVRKGMTLLELVIAMALTSIILTGAGVALYSMQKTSNREMKNHVVLSDAKTLSYAIDIVLKSDEHTSVTLNADKQNNIGKEECDILFTLDGVDYGFSKDTFGKVVEGQITGSDVKFHSTYAMYLSYRQEGSFTEFVIHYGDNYSQALSLVERI